MVWGMLGVPSTSASYLVKRFVCRCTRWTVVTLSCRIETSYPVNSSLGCKVVILVERSFICNSDSGVRCLDRASVRDISMVGYLKMYSDKCTNEWHFLRVRFIFPILLFHQTTRKQIKRVYHCWKNAKNCLMADFKRSCYSDEYSES